jgi:hypothetical protein
VVGHGQGVGEARARDPDVHQRGGGHAEPGRDAGGDVGGALGLRAGGDQYEVDVGGVQAAAGQGLGGGVPGQIRHALVGSGHVPCTDADPLLDPLVAGVHLGGQLVVRQDFGGLVVACGDKS